MNNSSVQQSQSQNPSSMDETMMSTVEGEPEGVTLYSSVIHNTLQKIISSVSADDFANLFQKLPSVNKRTINQIYNISMKYIYDGVDEQVADHITETHLCDKFAELKKLTEDYSAHSGKELWRPTHDARNDLRSHIMKEKIAFKKSLERLVSKKEESVNKLQYDITEARNIEKKIEERVDKAEETIRLIDGNIGRLLNYDKVIASIESGLPDDRV